jgi:hypothetical protein
MKLSSSQPYFMPFTGLRSPAALFCQLQCLPLLH